MKKIVILFFFLIFSLTPFIKPTFVFAAESCSSADIDISVSPSSAYTGSGPVTVTFSVVVGGSASLDLSYSYYIALESGADVDRNSALQTLTAGSNTFTITVPQNTNANWHIRLKRSDPGPNDLICQDATYQATKKVPVIHCSNGIKDADETGIDCGGSECIACAAPAVPSAAPAAPAAPATCNPEPGFGDPGTGVPTGLGCIPTQPQDLVKWILKYAILMGGGIAFLLSVFGGVSIILAGGNPEKINAGKEIIGSALTGLLFIIFSVFLLRFIGLDILQLPGFKP
ncbi:pilin [Microgenomates group bacterium]|nr:pilin [Microgenomates group bacterium]